MIENSPFHRSSYFIVALVMLLGSACSSFDSSRSSSQVQGERIEQLRPRAPLKTYSDTVEEQFLKIEQDQVKELERQRAIETYYQMRLEDQQNPERIERRRRQLVEQERRERPLPPPVQRVSSPKEEKDPLPKEVPRPVKIEAQQNVDYFCIQNEDHQKWSQNLSCHEFGEKQVNYCRDKYFSQSNFDLVQCVKRRLRV